MMAPALMLLFIWTGTTAIDYVKNRYMYSVIMMMSVIGIIVTSVLTSCYLISLM